MVMKIDEYLSKLPQYFWIPFILLLIIVIGLIDYATGWEVSFSVFYLLPVMLAAWFSLRWFSLVSAFLGAIAWLLADMTAGHAYSYPLIPYWNASVRLGFFLVSVYILWNLKVALEKEKELARTDPLTEVANVRAFFEAVTLEISRARRYNRHLTLAYMDIDDFKTVNDNAGHSTGDSILRLIAATIKNNLRVTDIIARMGGDEFSILLPETGQESVQTVLERVQKRLLGILKNIGYPVTFSIGVVTYETPPDSVDEIIRAADKLMYISKSHGKNTIKYEVR